MKEFSRPLGDAVKRARGKQDLTQGEVAKMINRDTRTVMNIENYKGNPKLEVLYPLIRSLQIDSREIFNPEMARESPSIRQLYFLIADCSEQEAATLIPVVEAVLSALRSGWGAGVEKRQ
ncbi:MAG: helix-turn-helix domain-containing protein [Oscillospiraceae bacterium]|nr:helix-turn-helix domain-containing protein [Oscillospiraceae bacterium]